MSFNQNDPAHLLALKTEVETDPNGLGYAAVIAETANLLALLNDKNSATVLPKPKISAAAVRGATTFDAYNNLSIDEQEWLRWITGSDGRNEESLVVSADVRVQLADPEGGTMWAVGNRPAMAAAMLALIDVPASRAEILFGFGTEIGRSDWFAARDS